MSEPTQRIKCHVFASVYNENQDDVIAKCSKSAGDSKTLCNDNIKCLGTYRNTQPEDTASQKILNKICITGYKPVSQRKE